MAFSDLDHLIAEAAGTINKTSREVQQTRDENVLDKLEEYAAPGLAGLVRKIIEDQEFQQLEKNAIAAAGPMKKAAAIPSNTLETTSTYNQEEAQLLRNENAYRADFGDAEHALESNVQNTILTYNKENNTGFGPETGDAILRALRETRPAAPQQEQRIAVQREGRGM